jgi:hypothetical protein
MAKISDAQRQFLRGLRKMHDALIETTAAYERLDEHAVKAVMQNYPFWRSTRILAEEVARWRTSTEQIWRARPEDCNAAET